LCLRTCTHEVFGIKIATLMCFFTFSAYNMPKNILNHYTTKKWRKHKKLGIGSNEHVGEGSGTQKKFKLLYCEKSENKIKAEHQKKFKLLCFRTYSHGVFEIKMTALMCSSNFSAYNMPKNILNHYTTKKDENTKSWAYEAMSTLEKAQEHKKI